MSVPESVALKRPDEFKLIGTSAKRLDTPAIVVVAVTVLCPS
jgi:isoquinoline 1-oxidoreductase subunit beta